MMTLNEFIKHGGKTQAKLANEIGISRSYLAEILSGKPPGRKTIEKIEAATNGLVPASIWFSQSTREPAQ